MNHIPSNSTVIDVNCFARNNFAPTTIRIDISVRHSLEPARSNEISHVSAGNRDHIADTEISR